MIYSTEGMEGCAVEYIKEEKKESIKKNKTLYSTVRKKGLYIKEGKYRNRSVHYIGEGRT